MSDLAQFDKWLSDGGPAALVAQEHLQSVEGAQSVIFPPTYAAEDGAKQDRQKFQGGYNIDTISDKENVCLIDSVGSQANRAEPIFAKPPYSALVPQILIKAGDKHISLLQAGHRAGDAIVRFTELGERVWDAFRAILDSGNAQELAKIAPTSLVFGVWDSRGTQAKVPRAFRSVIRAFNVKKLTRSAQFNRATKYVENGVIREELDTGDGDKNPLSREGMKDSPATATHGGVIADDIRRDVVINLSAIRRLSAGATVKDSSEHSPEDLRLRRYILGLCLVAATAESDDKYDLREGCLLRIRPDVSPQWREVSYNGPDRPLADLTAETALSYAATAAADFEVGTSATYEFDSSAAERWLAVKKEDQEKLRRTGPLMKLLEIQQTDVTANTPTSTSAEVPTRASKRGKRS
jgi:CRISPR-associated protein Csb1